MVAGPRLQRTSHRKCTATANSLLPHITFSLTRCRKKKAKDDNDKAKDPFRKPPVSQLKKTGESFLQDGPCFEVAPKLAKCRECRWTPNQRSKNTLNIFCRFYAFRRLR